MNTSLPEALAEGLAEDAETLALLQDRELNAETLSCLRHLAFPGNLALQADGEAVKAHQLMTTAMATLPAKFDQATLDELAADFAAIHLNGGYGASPSESVWLSDDHLICQESMFALRRIYAAKGLAAPDWRLRPDDHLVYQLQFVGHCLRTGRSDDDWRALAVFLDEHPLRWLGDFAQRVAHRCDTAFYAALSLLTAAWVEQLRNVLAALLKEARPNRETIEARMQRTPKPADSVPLAFVPGMGPTL